MRDSPHGITLLHCVLLLWSLPCLSFAPRRTAIQSPLHAATAASQWQFSLPESVLQKTFLLQGSTGRIKRVLLRLLMGQTVHIGALGGSVTAGKAANPGNDYFTLVTDWMVKAFPNATIVSRNGAIDGTTSSYMEHFVNSRLDADVDLVLVEYAVNNNYHGGNIHYDHIRSYERILRMILNGGHHSSTADLKPAAVLIVNMWRCCELDGKVQQYRPFETDLADQFAVLARYYSIPSVTARDGLYHEYIRGDDMFKNISEAYPLDENNKMVHPSNLGHRYMADMVIYAFYVILGQLEQYGITQGDLDLINSPEPPSLTAGEDKDIIMDSWHAEALTAVVSEKSEWTSGVEHGKWGYATTVPGTKLTILMDTRITANTLLNYPTLDPGSSVWVHFGLLKSYEHMGYVQISCVKGCSCKSVEINTHDPSDLTSQTTRYSVPVSQSDACKIRLVCLDKSTSKGKEHKLVLRGLALTVTLKGKHKRALPVV